VNKVRLYKLTQLGILCIIMVST